MLGLLGFREFLYIVFKLGLELYLFFILLEVFLFEKINCKGFLVFEFKGCIVIVLLFKCFENTIFCCCKIMFDFLLLLYFGKLIVFRFNIVLLLFRWYLGVIGFLEFFLGDSLSLDGSELMDVRDDCILFRALVFSV